MVASVENSKKGEVGMEYEKKEEIIKETKRFREKKEETNER